MDKPLYNRNNKLDLLTSKLATNRSQSYVRSIWASMLRKHEELCKSKHWPWRAVAAKRLGKGKNWRTGAMARAHQTSSSTGGTSNAKCLLLTLWKPHTCIAVQQMLPSRGSTVDWTVLFYSLKLPFSGFQGWISNPLVMVLSETDRSALPSWPADTLKGKPSFLLFHKSWLSKELYS